MTVGAFTYLLLQSREEYHIIAQYNLERTGRDMEDKAKGRLMILSTALLWGLAGVCVKSISWGTLSISAVRSAISLTMMLLVKRGVRVKLTKLNLLGGLTFCLTGTLYVAAIKLTTAGTAIVLQYVAPILVFLFEVVFRGKKPKAWEALLTLCVFFGIVLSFIDAIDMTHVIGNLLALLSGLFYAAHIILMNDSQSNADDCVVIGNMLSILIALPFLLNDPTLTLNATNIVWVLVLGVFQYGLPNILFAKGCSLLDSIELSLLLTIEPIFNPIPVAIVCGERMGLAAIAGAAIVIVSVTLYGLIPNLQKQKMI